MSKAPIIYEINKKTETLNVRGKNMFNDYIVDVIRCQRKIAIVAISPARYKRFKQGKTLRLSTPDFRLFTSREISQGENK